MSQIAPLTRPLDRLDPHYILGPIVGHPSLQPRIAGLTHRSSGRGGGIGVVSTPTLAGPVAIREADLEWHNIGSHIRAGYEQKYHGVFDPERGIALRMGSIYPKGDFFSPRHRHTFDNLRYVVRGRMRYGKEVYEAGDCIYIPESHYYGPMQPVASPTEEDADLLFIDIQYTGPSGIPYLEPEEVFRAQGELSKLGSFDRGIFKWPDGRNVDSYEAIHEFLTGEPPTYPRPRFDNYAVMHSASYPWIDLEGMPGVSAKHLGYFFETGPNIKLIQLKKGASTPPGTLGSQQVRFLLEGELEVEGEVYDSLSFFYYPPDAPYSEMKAVDEALFFVAQWALPGGTPPPFSQI